MKKIHFSFSNFFAFVIFGSVFAFFWNKNDPTINETYKNILLIIAGFIFGSSKSSQSKDDTIQSMQEDKTKANVIGDSVDTQNITVSSDTPLNKEDK